MSISDIVTPARFASGFTYQDFVAQVTVNRDRFDHFYGSFRLAEDDAGFFERAVRVKGGPAKLLVLGEDWCPDVFRGLPAMARVAEAAGIELKVFPRDKNVDIMNLFLNRGEFMSIPVFAFFTSDLEYICHFIERPASANLERAALEEQVKKEMPSASEQDYRTTLRSRLAERFPAWQQDTVREVRQMLAERLGVN